MMTTSLPHWAEGAVHCDVFSSGPWFRHFAETALGPAEPPLYLQWRTEQGDALALALKPGRGDSFPHARLLDSMTNYYSCGYGPIASAPASSAEVRNLVDALCHAARRYDGVRLGPMDRTSEFSHACEGGLRASGFRVFWTLAYRNWFAATAGMSFAQYLRSVPSSFPATSEKRRQAFLRKGQGAISITSSEDDLGPDVEAYERIYRESWKVPEPHPAFVPGLIRLAATQGWLRLGVLRVGGEPAAAQLWLVADGRALIFKVAYVERYAKLSVGSMLTCAMLERAIDVDHVREVDFLSGDDAYKAKWMFDRRDRHTLLAFGPWRLRGLLAGAREALAQRRDELMRRTESPPAHVSRVDDA